MGLSWSSFKSKRKAKKDYKRKLRKQLKEAAECLARLQEQLQLENEILDQCESYPSDDSMSDTETAHVDCAVAEIEEEVQALERKLFLEKIAVNVTEERCYFLDRNIRLLQNNEISLQRQRSVCEMDLAALKLKQEACQFGQFLKANPVEEWTVCSLPNLYFTEL
ncbi:hypothetical protein ACROYT_G001924 [Oculina patagonica]